MDASAHEQIEALIRETAVRVGDQLDVSQFLPVRHFDKPSISLSFEIGVGRRRWTLRLSFLRKHLQGGAL
jgi:hypothetical protein